MVLPDRHEAILLLYLPLQVEVALYLHRQHQEEVVLYLHLQHQEGAVPIQHLLLQAGAVHIQHRQVLVEVVQSPPDPLQGEAVEEVVAEEAAEAEEDNIRLVNFKT